MERSSGARPEYPICHPWWLSGAGICFGYLLPLYFIVAFAVDGQFPAATIRGLNFLTPGYLLLGAVLFCVAGLAAWIGQQIKPRPSVAVDLSDADTAALLLGAVVIVAYLIWFRTYLANPGLLLSILTGGALPTRQNIELVTGLTSLINCAPAFFSLYAWRRVFHPECAVPRMLSVLTVGICVFTVFRVYAWSERLALIESALPPALIYSLKLYNTRRPVLRVLVRFGPFAALPLLLLYFGAAEYVRSWQSNTYNGKFGFWEFALGRLASYYYTSLNNGAGLLSTMDWPTLEFQYVLGMFHTAPLGIGAVFKELVDSHTSPAADFLVKFGDPEFNNPSGLFTVVFDLGIPGALAYFIAVGFVSGGLLQRLRRGSLGAAMLYPMVFISLLELFRYPYLGTGRGFAWLVGIVVVLSTVHICKRRTRSAPSSFWPG